MPIKKSLKSKAPKGQNKKKTAVDIVIDEEIDMDNEELAEEDAEEVAEEEYFNQSSYDTFTKKYGIEQLSSNYYTNNDLHKEDKVVPPEERITSEIMTHAEYTRVVGERAKQIENGSTIFIVLKNDHDPIRIAEKEIKQKKCPLKITRYLTQNIKEEWNVNEMVIPFGINSG